MARQLFIIIVISLLCAGISLASTTIPETTFSSYIVWHEAGNPYIVTGLVTLDSAASLTIDAGVRVQFDAGPAGVNSGIIVNVGAFLFANGQPGDSIFLIGTGQMRVGFVVTYGYSRLNYCRFENMNGNYGDGYGGALLFNGCDSSLASHCMFYKNTCPLRGGGAISCKTTIPGRPIARATIKDCYFYGNHVDRFGAGGAIILEELSIADIIGCTFDSNYVEGWGSAGAIFIQSAVCGAIKNNIFKNNYAYYGGAIYSNYGMEGIFPITGNIFYHNRAVKGGAVWLDVATPGGNQYTIDFINNTLAENYADTVGGMFSAVTPTCLNNILWNNSAPLYPQADPNTLGLSRYSCIMEYSDSARSVIDNDPLFANPGYQNYHLSDGSPCLDTGDPDSAKDPDSTRADMGAYYFHQKNGSGDTNNDCRITGADVVYLIRFLKGTGPALAIKWKADANGNCVANGLDVTYLVNFFKGNNRGPFRNSSCVWVPAPPPDPCIW